jgi:hypothetical protein
MANMTRRKFLCQTTFAAAGTLTASLAQAAPIQYAGLNVARLRIRHPRKFRLLQFTDVHFFAGKEPYRAREDAKTVDLMHEVVDRSEPDLVLITGDLWHNNPGGRGFEYLQYSVRQMESLGVPWAFCWGNHDKLDDYAAGDELLTNAKGSLYRGAANDGSYIVEIVDSKDVPVWQIICLNSGEDGLAEPQWRWLKSLPNPEQAPTRWAAFHVPIRQFEDIWTNGAASGIKGEKHGYDNNEVGESLGVLKRAGIRACLCGHDHINDYSGIYDGIDLIYGRATGYCGYGAVPVPKGGKLFKINCLTGHYDWAALLAGGKEWRMKKGEQLDYEKKNAGWLAG